MECSECGRSFETEHGLATHIGLVHDGVDVECAACGSSIDRNPSQVSQSEFSYCDHSCRSKHLREGREVECDWCGEWVYRGPRDLEKNDYHFCDRSCYSSHTKATHPADFYLESGAGYPHWNITGERSIAVHQLLVIAYGADPHHVFDEKYNVHHDNGCAFDNRPENVDLVHVEEHGRLDGGKRTKSYTHMDLLHVVSFMINPRL
ncbi:hypothetical protein [Natrarchaeobaculum sulfurireducens]|uniref:C2H2-type domain-containing protein n=1 Tax=Natrarchaeobaculum sulfurireducens TaxID=2044521 RepID=A0A346PPN5_9EURY|nr:hypothetical protein [Natrarchaeobaculum sulfurireducens]AXR81480.1 hypothetical protein AArcMg_1467 [Natrarchaeobaculum sulfurireducens]